jgi:energy-coupling factor transporter transmembrane protein EcfT
MKTLFLLVAWCLLFVLCWPIALAAIVLFPLLWLLSIPFRIVSIVVESMLALFKAILLLPARILGGRGSPAGRNP